MKLSRFILSGIIATSSLSCVLPIASCSCKTINEPTIEFIVGDHISDVKITTKLEAGKELYITFTLEKGWEEIDLDKTTIKIGDKVLLYGRDYQVNAKYGYIRILPDVIQNDKLEINLVAKATITSLFIEWRSKDDSKYSFDNKFLASPDIKLSPQTLKVSAVRGDGSKEESQYAKAENWTAGTYSVYTAPSIKSEVDNFNEGISSEWNPQYMERYYIRYRNDYFDEWIEIYFGSLGQNPVTELKIEHSEDECYVAEPYTIGITANENASPACTWEIVSDETEQHNAILSNFGTFTEWKTYLLAKSVGTVTVRARSILNTSVVSNELTIDVKEWQPGNK